MPFDFDVHAVIYCDDAPTLEAALHREFQHRRVNRVNQRKEFFGVTIGEVVEAVRHNNCTVELTLAAEAEEYRKTQALLADTAVPEAPKIPSLPIPRYAETPEACL